MSAAREEIALLPCPFCGGTALIERIGTARQSCVIICEGCGCRLETGEVWSMGERWNKRAVVSAVPSGNSELADQLENLCCAETEAKFFDLVTDSISTILAALRSRPSPAPKPSEGLAELIVDREIAEVLVNTLRSERGKLSHERAIEITLNTFDAFRERPGLRGEAGAWQAIETRPDSDKPCWIGDPISQTMLVAYPGKRMPKGVWYILWSDRMVPWSPKVWQPLPAAPAMVAEDHSLGCQ